MSKPVEIDLSSYEEVSVARRYEIDGILTNIHGEHAQRTQVITDIVYDETREYTQEEKTKLEKKRAKSSRPETIHTFPKDEERNLLVPLGGNHGYFMGALRVAVKDLYKDQLKNRNWEGYGLSTMINHSFHITPEWVSVGKEFSHPPEKPMKHMVITAGISKAMMPIYYDVVARSKIHITIEQSNPKIPEKLLLQMVAYLQKLGLGPKGRGSLLITKMIRTK